MIIAYPGTVGPMDGSEPFTFCRPDIRLYILLCYPASCIDSTCFNWHLRKREDRVAKHNADPLFTTRLIYSIFRSYPLTSTNLTSVYPDSLDQWYLFLNFLQTEYVTCAIFCLPIMFSRTIEAMVKRWYVDFTPIEDRTFSSCQTARSLDKPNISDKLNTKARKPPKRARRHINTVVRSTYNDFRNCPHENGIFDQCLSGITNRW